MLEAALATAVLGILASIALPKLSYMLDVSYVDYEIKCLHSMMHYTKSICRLALYNDFGFGPQSGYTRNTIELRIKTADPDAYYVRKWDSSDRIKENRYIERGFNLENYSVSGRIRFDFNGDFNPGENGRILLLKNNLKRTLVLSGYGRARIDRE